MKASITNENFQYTDVLGMPTKKATVKKIEDENKNVIYFDKDKILRDIDDFANTISKECVTDKKLKEYGINTTVVKFKEAIEKLKKYVSSIDDTALKDIIDNAPRFKNGNIRNTKLPLYMTGLTFYEGDYDWSRITSIELSLIPTKTYSPVTSASSIFAPPTKVANTFNIEFTTYEREYSKTDIPIVDKNFKYNKVSYSRNSYIKAEDLIIGNIYKDKKGGEFLYLGSIVGSWSSDKFKSLGYKVDDESMKNYEQPYSYVFFKLSDKTKKSKTLGLSFKDWFTPILTNKMTKKDSMNPGEFDEMAFSNLFKISKSFKVLEDLGPFFDKDEMECTIDIKASDKLGNEYRTILRVPVVDSKKMYCVYDGNSRWRGSRPILYKSFDKKSADAYAKTLKSKYTYIEDIYAPIKYKSRYFAETSYWHTSIGYSDDITKIDDVFKKFESTPEAIAKAKKYGPAYKLEKDRLTPREEFFPIEKNKIH